MLKPELHDFLIENGGEYLKNKSSKVNLNFDWNDVYAHSYIFKDDFIIYFDDNDSIKTWSITYKNHMHPLHGLYVEKVTLEILKQTLINAGIEIKERYVGNSDEPHECRAYPGSLVNSQLHTDGTYTQEVACSICNKPFKLKIKDKAICNTFVLKNTTGKIIKFNSKTASETTNPHLIKELELIKESKLPQFMLDIQLDNFKQMGMTKQVDKYLESKQMETKTAKWQIDDGNVIESTLSITDIYDAINKLYPNLKTIEPEQKPGLKPSDFTILLFGGKTQHAKYMAEPEFKVGDVVKTSDGLGKIIEIASHINVRVEFSNGERRWYGKGYFKLITSFEDWCKDNLPEGWSISESQMSDNQ